MLYLTLLLAALGCLAREAAAAERDDAPIVIQAEEAVFRGGAVEEKSAAQGGKCLGSFWGSRETHRADFTFTVSRERACSAFIRYSLDQEHYARRHPESFLPHALRVYLDEQAVSDRLEVPDTAGWNIFCSLRVPLGRVAAGRHTLRLAPVGPQNDVNLDSVTFASATETIDTRAAAFTPAGSRHYRIRLSPRVDPERFPARLAYACLEAQHAFHQEFLGFEPERTGLFTVIAAADWREESVSAYTSYGLMYLQEREAATPGGNYAHEMFHLFEEGLAYPTWWSEGMAFLLAMRSEVEVYGRRQAEVDAEAARLREWWEAEGRKLMVRDGVNQVVWWGTPRMPADVGSHPRYRAANLVVYSLWQREGDALFKRLYTLIQADRAAGEYLIPKLDPVGKQRALLEYLDRAAGKDLSEFWKEWAIPGFRAQGSESGVQGGTL